MIKKLSIVIPVYNEERSVHEILDLVRDVKLINDIEKELIIVNDFSTDDTKGKIEEYIANHPEANIRLFTQEKRILAILADISARVPDTISMHVSRLVVDQDSVKIKGTTDAFNNVNVIKKVLARSARFSEVNIVSATKAKDCSFFTTVANSPDSSIKLPGQTA